MLQKSYVTQTVSLGYLWPNHSKEFLFFYEVSDALIDFFPNVQQK